MEYEMIFQLNKFVNRLYYDYHSGNITCGIYEDYIEFAFVLYKCLLCGRGQSAAQILIDSYNELILKGVK